MNKNHNKDQESQSTTTGHKQNQPAASAKNNTRRNDDETDRYTSSKSNADSKINKGGMDHDNKNHDTDRNRSSKH